MRVLITGATGLLGNNVARIARSLGHEIVTLSRSPHDHPSLVDLDGEHVQCDLNDPRLHDCLSSLHVDAVIHSAALIHIGWKRVADSLKVNEQGTREILSWTAQRGIRGVYVSTVNVLPLGEPERPGHEESIGDGQLPTAYVISKRAAQKVVDQAVSDGQDWYSVFPGFMLGPYDWQISSGKMIQPLQRFMPWAPAGGCSVCDPRDVAVAMIRIAENGAQSREYVLAGHNVTYLELWTRIANQLGTKPPMIAMKLPAKVIGQISADIINTIRREEQEFNSAAIEMGQQFHYYSSERAQRQLSYKTRDIQESIQDAVDWLAAHGHLPRYYQRLLDSRK